jgi:cellulose biosynthesis protein BcsQ
MRRVAESLDGIKDFQLFKTVIRDSNEIMNAEQVRRPVVIHRPKSIGAIDYLALSREVIKRCKMNSKR